MITKKAFTFHTAQTGISDGLELTVRNQYSQMTIDIETDATALTVNFEAQSTNGNWIAYKCYNFTTGNTATLSVAFKNELWQADLLGITKFRTTITAQTGGTGTTIIGRILG